MKLLIADDEDYTREGIFEGIQWKNLGIDEVLQARDGQSALKIAKWFIPDIVLTDIKMPRMDGIELAKELIADNSKTKIIFMSGYMEVEYLKSAIHLSAVDYIEKPINLNNVKLAVMKSIEDINNMRETQMLSEDRKELQQQKIANMLISKNSDKGMLEKLCNDIAFPLDANYISVVLWDKDNNSNTDKLCNDILNFFRNRNMTVLCKPMDNGRYLLIISYNDKHSSRLPFLYRSLIDEFKFLILGIGFEVDSIFNIYNSYQTALLAINSAFYDEEKQIFMVDEYVKRPKLIEPNIYGEFVKMMRERPSNLTSWCDDLFVKLKKQKYYRKENIQMLFTSFVTAMANEHGEVMDYITYKQSSDGNYGIEQIINGFATLSEIQIFFMGLVNIIEKKHRKRSKYSRVICGVMDYIAKNYRDANLSVGQIADHFNLSATYLNVLFKQEMDITLKRYLSDYRIDHAKKLLKNSFYKITDICELCGYNNSNYFAKVFKEATGLTPLEYRRQNAQ